jgi:hypothetical protein
MMRNLFGRLATAVRHEPIRLLPLLLGLLMFLFFATFVALTGRIGRRVEEELPEGVDFVTVG